MRATTIAGASVLAAALIAGCAAIPESSPVEVVGPRGSETSEPPVAPPPAGIDPLALVRGFVEASARQANRHAAARAFLTDQTKLSWDDTGPVVVLDDTFNTVYATSPGDSQGDYREVLLRGQQLGELGPDGAFTANRSTVTPTMELIKEKGEWRISRPPAAMHILFTAFGTTYRSIGVKFVDRSRGTLVTDRRWVLAQPSAGWPSRAIDLLLGGPSAAVRDAVTNELEGAKTRTNVVLGDDDVLTVDLTAVRDMDENQRRLAAAQIVGSVGEFVSGRIRIQVDGAPLVSNKVDWTAADALPFTPDESVKPDLPALAIDHGRLVRAEGGAGVAGPAGDGSMPVESAAQSIDGSLLALVTNAGRPQLWFGPPEAPLPVALQATSMTRPTWRRGQQPEVWTVINGGAGAGVRRSESGELITFGVDLSDLAVKGRITELRLSRDGVRVAAIVGGGLFVAIVVGTPDGPKVRNPRLLVGPGAAQIADVDWKGRDKVVVATVSRDRPQVFDVTIDGLNWTAYQETNLTAPLIGIAATAGRPVLVADQGGLWYAGDTNDLWYSEGLSRGTDPLYPG